MHVANYNEARQMLAATVEGPAQDTAIFISGQSNFGKTLLLNWLKEEYAAKARFVRLDLAEPGELALTTPLLVMNDCARRLGSDHFTDYREARERRARNQAIIKDVTATGNNITIQALAGSNPEEQLADAIELTSPFVRGLVLAAAAGLPIVICIDGYCSAKALTRSWIEGALVGELARTRCVRLVIAGQQPASERLREEAGSLLPISLGGVHDVGEWMRVARELGSVLPGSNDQEVEFGLRVFVDGIEGDPGRIMRWLQRQAPRPQV
jgi:hypothetical protein